MKYNGSVSHIYIKRDMEVLPDLVRRAKHIATYPINMTKVYNIAANLAVDRFYISDDAAYEYMRKRMIAGIKPSFSSPYKQKLYDALYQEVTNMMSYNEKYQELGWKHTTTLALLHPAPCVGLTPYIIGATIRKRNRHRHKKHE